MVSLNILSQKDTLRCQVWIKNGSFERFLSIMVKIIPTRAEKVTNEANNTGQLL